MDAWSTYPADCLSVPFLGRSVDGPVDHSPPGWGNLPCFWGILAFRLTKAMLECILPVTPNTARGSGTGEPASRMGQELRLRSQEEGRDPGEAPEVCSGRTATTLGPRGTSGSATGTRVSRPGGAATSLRARSQTARVRPRPGPGHRRSSRRRRASRGPTVRPDSGARSTGLFRRRAEGQNGRPGSHRGPVDESGPGTEVDGRSGIRIRVTPLGAETGMRNEEAAPRS